jgi:hypothetical protein
MKLSPPGRKYYVKEQTEQGVRQWLIVAALVASLLLIFIGIRLIGR